MIMELTLGEKLKRRRLAKGWTQVQLGRLAQISATSLADYERDYREPGAVSRSRLCKALELDSATYEPLEGPEPLPRFIDIPKNEPLAEAVIYTITTSATNFFLAWALVHGSHHPEFRPTKEVLEYRKHGNLPNEIIKMVTKHV